MEDFARAAYAKSQYYVPVHDPEKRRPHDVEGGSLKESGVVFRGDLPGEWIVGYGGSGLGTPRDPTYAVYVHEILDYTHDEPTRAKYLEVAVAEILPELIQEAGPTFVARFYAVGGTGAPYVPQRESKYMPFERSGTSRWTPRRDCTPRFCRP